MGSDYASGVKVDGDEAGHLAYLYYFLRSDAKTGLRRSWLSAALRLMIDAARRSRLEDAAGHDPAQTEVTTPEPAYGI